jgi:hypothetical protein
MTSVHANSAREALVKLTTLPLLAGENVSRPDHPDPSGSVRIRRSTGGLGGTGGCSGTLRPAPSGAVREHHVSRGAGEDGPATCR